LHQRKKEMSKKFKVAINRKIINKVDGADKNKLHTLTVAFENVELTVAEFAEQISRGHPFCAQHEGRRKSANFTCSDVIAVDIDKGMLLSEALANSYIQQQAAFLYTTPSHTEEAHRFRIVFVLDRTVTDSVTMRYAYQGLIRKFGSDAACRDACRLFYGSEGAEPIILGNTLCTEELANVIALGSEPASVPDNGQTHSAERQFITPKRSNLTLDLDAVVKLASGEMMRLRDVPLRTPIYCPIHLDLRPSAYVLESKRSIKGVHCSTCAATYWPEEMQRSANDSYDFYKIERIVAAHEAEENTLQNFYDDPGQFDVADASLGLLAMPLPSRSSYTMTQRHLPNTKLQEGVTFARSPKGSGKTEWLSNIVDECRKRNLKVLLVGHRRTLLQSMCERLGLTCYYHSQNGYDIYRSGTNFFAISIDSISKLLEPSIDKYDVIFIDESEQVFSHLTSSTLGQKRRASYQILFHYLAAASSVLLSDADLGPITIDGIYQALGGDKKYTFYSNNFPADRCDFHYYDNEAHLWQELIRAVSAGGRHYVATNSIAKAKQLEEAILLKVHNIPRRHNKIFEFDDVNGADRARDHIDDVLTGVPRIMLITSDTSGLDRVQNFIRNIKTEIFKYDVVIASPSMGTGIDISFLEDGQFIDTVFGFFVSKVNTHFDIDQQISRVRNPKAIKTWVTPERFNFETEPEVIRREAIKNGVLNDSLIGYERDTGKEIVDERYVSIYSHVVGISRASKNNLRQNLQELRIRNGWNVVHVSSDGVDTSVGIGAQSAARDKVNGDRNDGICKAKKIDFENFTDLTSNNYTPDEEERHQIERYRIEQFYKESATTELVELDKKGRFRDQINLLVIYLSTKEELAKLDSREIEINGIVTDSRKRSLKQKILQAILNSAGVTDGINNFRTDVIKPESLDMFITICRKHELHFQDMFGITLRRDIEKKPMQQLGCILELIGLSLEVKHTENIAGKKIRHYGIESCSMQIAIQYANRRLDWNGSKL
jgi:hypothetical protein